MRSTIRTRRFLGTEIRERECVSFFLLSSKVYNLLRSNRFCEKRTKCLHDEHSSSLERFDDGYILILRVV